MAKEYKVWIVVEEIDHEEDTYKDIEESEYFSGTFQTLKEADDIAYRLSLHYRDNKIKKG